MYAVISAATGGNHPDIASLDNILKLMFGFLAVMAVIYTVLLLTKKIAAWVDKVRENRKL